MRKIIACSVGALCSALLAGPVAAQSTLDRVAPAARPPEPTPELPVAPDIQIGRSGAQTSVIPAGELMIGAISLKGLSALTPDQFSDILGDYVGRTVQPAELAALTDRIADRARARGYVFATAHIAPQRLTAGVLVVEVDEGRVDRLDVDGNGSAAVRAALEPLVNGKPVRLADLERRLLIAGDVDGVRIRQVRLLREGDRDVLVVNVSQDRASGRLALRDDGTRPIGPIQIHIDAMITHLLAVDDSLSINYSAAVFEPKELQSTRLRYQKQIGADGTELSLNASYSSVAPGSYLTGSDILGRSWSASVGVLHPLYRRRQSSLWLTGSLEVNSLTQRWSGSLGRRDRETVLRVGLYGYDNVLGGRFRVSAVVSQGLDLLEATEANDTLASRPGADGSFTMANIWLEWTRSLRAGFSVRLAADSQLASQPLLIGEQASLGGSTFLRGYDWSERSGDQGIMGSAEIRYDVKRPLGIADRAQFYAFADGGALRDLSSGVGGGSLASAGGGLRIDFSKTIGATAEIAVPLTGPRYDTGNQQPRWRFGLSTSF